MKLFETNPYLILGIKANATPAEKEKARNTITAYLKIGKDPILDFDLCPPFKQISRSVELIDLKSNEILSESDRIIHSLFWFISGGIKDDIGLSKLTSTKDIEAAKESFLKSSKNFNIDEESVCSIINYSTLEIISFTVHKDRTRLKEALSHKLSIVSTKDGISHLCKWMNINNSRIVFKDVQKEVLNRSKNLLIELFPEEDKDHLMKEFFEKHKELYEEELKELNLRKIQQIKSFVEQTKKERELILKGFSEKGTVNVSELFRNSGRLGKDLQSNTAGKLKEIKNSFGIKHTSTVLIYESVLDEINYCGVLALNSFMDKVSNSSDSRKKELFRSLNSEDLTPIISMTNLAIQNLGDVDTIILRTIKENLEFYSKLQNKIKGSSGSDSLGEGCGSLGGCLGEIIGRLIGLAIGFGILAFLGLILKGC